MNIDFKEKDIIDIIYQAQEEEVDKILREINKKLKDQLYDIEFDEFIKDSSIKEKLKEIFYNLEDNYNIKITEYNKELYRLGFVDGINLMLNIVKESNN